MIALLLYDLLSFVVCFCLGGETSERCFLFYVCWMFLKAFVFLGGVSSVLLFFSKTW